MKKTTRKLQLKTETIRALQRLDLSTVAGGTAQMSNRAILKCSAKCGTTGVEDPGLTEDGGAL